ncbi:hypothetical protein PF008_g33339, partial [Phytophthora fragariae]
LKRRQRSCKVCAVYKVQPRKYTKYFCPECSTGNRRTYLCNVVREGKEKTCFHIWHDEWSNGNAIPRRLQDHKIRNRPPASRPGKKRRRRTVEGAAGESEGSGGATSDVAPGSDDGLADDEAQESTVERRTQSSETIL